MDNKISPEAQVAELELDAVIGFNGEASSIFGLAGLGTRRTCSANRNSETPGTPEIQCGTTAGALVRDTHGGPA